MLDRHLTVDGRGGDDIISASSAAVDLTLVGGGGDNVLIGGPGNDHLIGGDGFDDVSGGKGSDVAGSAATSTASVEAGRRLRRGRRRRLARLASFTGTNDGEASRSPPTAAGCGSRSATSRWRSTSSRRSTRSLGGGADTFAVGDLSRTDAQLVDISLAPLPITPLATSTPTASPSTAPTRPTRSSSPARS